MSVEVIIPPFLQSLTGEAKTIIVPGNTVNECLVALAGKYPGLKARLFDSKNKLRRGINLFINENEVSFGGPAAQLQDGDKLYITSIIMGG
jgi:sulfur-carrier protein